MPSGVKGLNWTASIKISVNFNTDNDVKTKSYITRYNFLGKIILHWTEGFKL